MKRPIAVRSTAVNGGGTAIATSAAATIVGGNDFSSAQTHAKQWPPVSCEATVASAAADADETMRQRSPKVFAKCRATGSAQGRPGTAIVTASA